MAFLDVLILRKQKQIRIGIKIVVSARGFQTDALPQ